MQYTEIKTSKSLDIAQLHDNILNSYPELRGEKGDPDYAPFLKVKESGDSIIVYVFNDSYVNGIREIIENHVSIDIALINAQKREALREELLRAGLSKDSVDILARPSSLENGSG